MHVIQSIALGVGVSSALLALAPTVHSRPQAGMMFFQAMVAGLCAFIVAVMAP